MCHLLLVVHIPNYNFREETAQPLLRHYGLCAQKTEGTGEEAP